MTDRKRELQWQRQILMETWSILAEEFANGMEQRSSGRAGEADQIRSLGRSAYEEAKLGAFVSQIFQVVVARKSGD